ncbi:MAG: cupin domain-containing protein [Deltaproteobacteria bacterium]|nr:cupin domain-containing protein [Deltaproteobacteria bacterium]
MPRLATGNLLDTPDAPNHGERFTSLAELGGVTIESIVSSATPDAGAYDQPHDEWVVLLAGNAAIEVEGRAHVLRAGDWILLPAHARHRVLATSAGARWLAVHVGATTTPPTGSKRT